MEKRKPAKSFKDLVVWQRAHQLVLSVYKCTKNFPKEERYGLTSQIRRSIVSVAANLAEGFKKRSDVDKLRFYNISQGSLAETEYYLILAKDLEYADTDSLACDLEEVSRLLEGLMRSIKAVIPNTRY